MYCLVRSPPMTVRAVRPAAAAMSRKSANGLSSVTAVCTAKQAAHTRALPRKSFMTSSRQTKCSRRIGLQNVDGQASLGAKFSSTVSRNEEDGMRIQPGLFRACVLALTLMPALSAPAIAQVDTGTISGTVKDASGGVLPGATVIITHEGQALTLKTVTRVDGTYI